MNPTVPVGSAPEPHQQIVEPGFVRPAVRVSQPVVNEQSTKPRNQLCAAASQRTANDRRKHGSRWTVSSLLPLLGNPVVLQ